LLVPTSEQPDDGSRSGTAVQADNTSSNGGTNNVNDPASGNRAKNPLSKNLVSNLLFTVVVLFALANCQPNNILAHFWVVVMAIVCPLLDMFIPGIFYFRVMKDVEGADTVEGDRDAGVGDKFKRCMARFYTILGAVFLPLLLTLATKALFSTTKNPTVIGG